MIITEAFMKIAGMSITAAIIAAAVIILRLLLRRVPKIFSYVLWAAVFFRLLCPFSFTLSSAPIEPVTVGIQQIKEYNSYDTAVIPILTDEGVSRAPSVAIYRNAEEDIKSKPVKFLDIISLIWLAGVCIMAVYGVISAIKLKIKLNKSSIPYDGGHESKNIFTSEKILNSFIMGIICPKIYLPAATVENLELIVRHEQTHLRRGDHIVKLIMYYALCLHWFNPMVWLSFKLCERDMEMSCDERVTADMTKEAKADYSQALLNAASSKSDTPFTPCFSESSTEARIKNVLSFKKPALRITAVCTVIIAAVSVLLIADKEPNQNNIFTEMFEQNYDEYDFVLSSTPDTGNEIYNKASYYFSNGKIKSSEVRTIVNLLEKADLKMCDTDKFTFIQSPDYISLDLMRDDPNKFGMDSISLFSGISPDRDELFFVTADLSLDMEGSYIYEIDKESYDKIQKLVEGMFEYDENNRLIYDIVQRDYGRIGVNDKVYTTEEASELLNSLCSTYYRRIDPTGCDIDYHTQITLYPDTENEEYNSTSLSLFSAQRSDGRIFRGISVDSTNSNSFFETYSGTAFGPSINEALNRLLSLDDYKSFSDEGYPLKIKMKTPSPEALSSVYFGSEFPYILYADSDWTIFTEGSSYMFIVTNTVSLSIDVEASFDSAELPFQPGGYSFNGIGMGAYKEDGKFTLYCSASNTYTGQIVFYIIDIINYELTLYGESPPPSPRHLQSADEKSNINCFDFYRISADEATYLKIRNIAECESHLSLIEIVRQTRDGEETIIPFPENCPSVNTKARSRVPIGKYIIDNTETNGVPIYASLIIEGNGTGYFSYSLFSSYTPVGICTVEGDRLILKVSDSEKYVFDIIKDGSTLSFNEKATDSVYYTKLDGYTDRFIDSNKFRVYDGAVFTYTGSLLDN